MNVNHLSDKGFKITIIKLLVNFRRTCMEKVKIPTKRKYNKVLNRKYRDE